MGKVIKGKPVADALTEWVQNEVVILKNDNVFPKLAIIRIGNKPSDLAYERGALKRMERCGIDVEVIEFPENISQNDFVADLSKINRDEKIHGILVFRPMPKQIDENIIKYIISPEKDVDCFSPVNVAKVTEGDKTGFPPATPTAVLEILKYYDVDLVGKHAVIIGNSMVVGRPVSLLLLNEKSTATICHSKTQKLPEICNSADIIVSAVGKAKLVDDSYVKDGAVIIDVGINVDVDGKICGDVDFDSCHAKSAMITPVPLGVGSVTTSVLAKHVVKACKILISSKGVS